MGLCRHRFPGLEVAILRALLPMGAKFSSMTGGPRWEEEFLLVAGGVGGPLHDRLDGRCRQAGCRGVGALEQLKEVNVNGNRRAYWRNSIETNRH